MLKHQFLIHVFIAICSSHFLTSNRIDPERDRFVTVQEYYNQIKCTKGCEQNCYNFMTYRWDELSANCYECIGNCSAKVAPAKLVFKPPSFLVDTSVCCPSYEAYYATVSVHFEVSNKNILKEAYIVWEYRMSRGVYDFAPSPWMTILQTRAERATIEGLIRDVSFQFRANLVDGIGPVERLLTQWIDIEDFPATSPHQLVTTPTKITTKKPEKTLKTTTMKSMISTTTTKPFTTEEFHKTNETEKILLMKSNETELQPKKIEKERDDVEFIIGKKVDPNLGLFKRA
ncbi:unnamed protein product, partial [Mesorhabditis belari]|uniref:Uncharacterized protein n=1 Tax=Mesorhabditis belari TaxID=2138241 RepID=A0AAF3EAI9_9BILA